MKQFTGEHWKYWERLPFDLDEAKDSPRKLNNIISKLKYLSGESDERLRKRRLQLEKWREKEVVINAQLMSISAALPEKILAIMFGHLINLKEFPSKCRVVCLKIEGIKGEDLDFVEPDILLLGASHLLMIEIKTRGGATSSRSYPPTQLLNYMKLVAGCKKLSDGKLPSKFFHLIIVPSEEKKWLENYPAWVNDVRRDGLLRIDNKFFDKLIKETIKKDGRGITSAVNETPIYYKSWDYLIKSFDFANEKFNDKNNTIHWNKIGDELKKLIKVATNYI
ncbi:MAG: hypothetical protein AAB451_03410 [Patescibacteria group bacterium]